MGTKVVLELFPWDECKPKNGSEIVTWGYNNRHNLGARSIHLPGYEGPYDLEVRWVHEDDETESLPYNKEFEMPGYYLGYFFDDELVIEGEDDGFYWAYSDEFEWVDI